MTDELHFLTIADAAQLIKARKLSPVEYTDALLNRIETFEPQLNAFITLAADKAREQARNAEAEIAAGVKAVIAEMGAPTIKEMGTVMKNVMAHFQAASMRVDGKTVSELVKRELSSTK